MQLLHLVLNQHVFKLDMVILKLIIMAIHNNLSKNQIMKLLKNIIIQVIICVTLVYLHLHPSETIVHKKAFRPWGWYINIEGHDNSGFKVKHIVVYPGKRLFLQSHNHRSEHWVIVKGNAIVQIGKDKLPLSTNQHIYIFLKKPYIVLKILVMTF